MSAFKETQEELNSIEVVSIDMEERIKKPSVLRNINSKFCKDDEPTSENRAAVQELMDFAPPYDQAELESRGMGERFNVNYGLAASIKNEAVGAYLDIYTSPQTLVKIALNSDVDPDMRSTWADIMSDEWTKAFRSWDVSMSNMLLLADIFVTHGIAIPCFEDKSSMLFEVMSLEECKFDALAEAIPSKVEIMTINRDISVTQLYSKIEGKEGDKDINGWNGPAVKALIENAKPKSTSVETWNYEEAGRLAKANRIGSGTEVPNIELIWGIVRELDGSISVYATPKDDFTQQRDYPTATILEDEWVYRKRKAFDDANQMFQIFPFSVGNKNKIYTIRGLGYALYEPGQADNILRCKMMDSARYRSGEIYESDTTVESVDDLQFIDFGFGIVAPKGLRISQQPTPQRLNDSIGFAIQSNETMINKHSAGLAGNSFINNPTARRNEMQVQAELEHLNKMTGFAISLFYGPYDKLIRELVRRGFQETQTDLVAAKIVKRMKKACIAKGVPRDVFEKIDLEATQATRLMGAGSKGSRIIAFQQMGELFSSMDPIDQENYVYDYATEIKGAEASQRYFGTPGERRGHVDASLAQLENAALLEGDVIEPVDGENRMVHLSVHIEELHSGLQGVNEGEIDLAQWTLQNIPLYQHAVQTLEVTTVHPARMGELNSFRQQLQQVGEIIENGMRHINKLQREQEELGMAEQQVDEQGNPIQAEGEMSPAAEDNKLKRNRMVAESAAKLDMMRTESQAKIAIEKTEAFARIALKDAEAAAKIKRDSILAKQKNRR